MTQEDRHWQQHLTASVVGCRLCFPPIKQPTYMEKVELIKSFKTGENLAYTEEELVEWLRKVINIYGLEKDASQMITIILEKDAG
jgi:hypothetical protein